MTSAPASSGGTSPVDQWIIHHRPLDELHSHDSTNEEHGRYSKGMDRKPTKRNDGVGEDTGHVSRSSIHKVATRTDCSSCQRRFRNRRMLVEGPILDTGMPISEAQSRNREGEHTVQTS